METIILDYTNANVILWKHEQVFDVDDMEERILEKFGLKGSSIEWISSESLDFIIQREGGKVKVFSEYVKIRELF